MNDYSEIEYGKNLILSTYKNTEVKTIISSILDGPQITDGFETILNNLVYVYLHHCYIASLSEHHIGDDQFGRLSMWRAYAPENGVALILNNEVFLDKIDDYMSVTIPVNYIDEDKFFPIFKNFLIAVNNDKKNVLKEHGFEHFFSGFINGMINFITTSKHPAFEEELEWRMLYLPKAIGFSKYIDMKVLKVGDIVQIINSINIDELRRNYGSKFSFNNLIYKILIGPSAYPLAIQEAIIEKLKISYFEEPMNRVHMTFIPLRT